MVLWPENCILAAQNSDVILQLNQKISSGMTLPRQKTEYCLNPLFAEMIRLDKRIDIKSNLRE